MRKIDPYDVLGVQRGADADAVKAAYRNAAKSAHPDAGGSAKAFEELSACRDLLLDPARRRRFDETGEFGDASPNNDRTNAMAIILSHRSRMIEQFVQSDFNPDHDPARCDVVNTIKAKILDAITSTRLQLKTGEKHRRAIESIRERLVRKGNRPGADVLGAALTADIARINQTIAALEDGIRIATLACEMVSEYDFKIDKSDPPPRPSFSSRIRGVGDSSIFFTDEYGDFAGSIFGSGGRR